MLKTTYRVGSTEFKELMSIRIGDWKLSHEELRGVAISLTVAINFKKVADQFLVGLKDYEAAQDCLDTSGDPIMLPAYIEMLSGFETVIEKMLPSFYAYLITPGLTWSDVAGCGLGKTTLSPVTELVLKPRFGAHDSVNTYGIVFSLEGYSSPPTP
jgi:hypothetical protein